MLTFRRIITTLLCLFLVFWIGVNIVLEIHYSSHLPRISEASTGHVYEMTVNHGFVVYGTNQELRYLMAARKSFPIAFACFVFLFILKLTFRDTDEKREKKLQ